LGGVSLSGPGSFGGQLEDKGKKKKRNLALTSGNPQFVKPTANLEIWKPIMRAPTRLDCLEHFR
jgi:hypothetical protein